MMCLHPAADRGLRCTIAARDECLGCTVFEECLDLNLVFVQFAFANTPGSAELYVVISAKSEQVLGPRVSTQREE